MKYHYINNQLITIIKLWAGILPLIAAVAYSSLTANQDGMGCHQNHQCTVSDRYQMAEL